MLFFENLLEKILRGVDGGPLALPLNLPLAYTALSWDMRMDNFKGGEFDLVIGGRIIIAADRYPNPTSALFWFLLSLRLMKDRFEAPLKETLKYFEEKKGGSLLLY